MQNSGFPTYNNIFHVSVSDFDVQKWRALVLCCRGDKNCSFLRQFWRHWLVNSSIPLMS